MSQDIVASPCINICQLSADGLVCVGCGRTREEIADWLQASAAQRREIVQMAAARKAGYAARK